ncbi:hypothetical protein [Ornithinimicrobium sp. INDO-MA30-4]|uniref:hypothetical protein n=1 Tax=Ornithinimicrobium sp. INDO-MA30-4 TaxID=2908651 RepID=UPI001F348C3E|nr:hypothetical protein [Ornithinimicrobium sp. INDO-MA30-4]UJH70904.1 hypothetical protein L0A91_02705 [Ornithinimicrobium sp. INDO-MA30-4]
MHIKGDDLAELAIGGTDLDAAGHVADCAKCAAEVEALSDIARRLAEFAPLRVPPPPHVWTAIHAEVTGVEATVVDIDQAREGGSAGPAWSADFFHLPWQQPLARWPLDRLDLGRFS